MPVIVTGGVTDETGAVLRKLTAEALGDWLLTTGSLAEMRPTSRVCCLFLLLTREVVGRGGRDEQEAGSRTPVKGALCAKPQ